MIFYDNENLIQLNKELWVIPILLLIILLYLTREKRNRKIIIAISTIYVLFLLYNLYFVFLPLFALEDTLFYYVEYPFGFVFLGLTLFLILNIFFPNKSSSYIAIALTIIVVFNQIYLRIQTNSLKEEYKAIIENNSDGILFNVKFDSLDFEFQNLPNDYSKFIERVFVNRKLSFKPYVSLKSESIFNFKFPNYYWTEYLTGDTRTITKKIESNFVEPKLIESFKLKPKNNIKVFYGLFEVDKEGSIVHTPNFFPDSTNYINYNNYIRSIKFIPGYFEGKPVRVLYHIKFTQ